MKKYNASMKSIASYVPQKYVDNHFFSTFLDTDDEWIRQRTGIKGRHFASDELSSDLGYKAGLEAIKRAGLKNEDIELIICSTISPDFYGMPSTACIIASKLGLEIPAFDITAACSGFIYLLSIAKAYIESGMYRNILIIGAEKISNILDFKDRSTCVLFGDGAGASVICRSEKEGIKDVHINSNGSYANLLYTPSMNAKRHDISSCISAKDSKNSENDENNANVNNESANDFKNNDQKNSDQYLKMQGNNVFKLAVKTIANDAKYILHKNNLSHDDIDFFIPHQANLRIINSVAKELDIGNDKIIITVDKFGNTSAASIPMAIDYALQNNTFKNGDLLLLDAFGGGLTWGSALVFADFA